MKISPSSSIWGSPSKLDKENTNKGPVNTQPSPLQEILKAEGERKRMPRRPFSPAFEVSKFKWFVWWTWCLFMWCLGIKSMFLRNSDYKVGFEMWIHLNLIIVRVKKLWLVHVHVDGLHRMLFNLVPYMWNQNQSNHFGHWQRTQTF